ncbi:MAG TPA: Cof-type HAD-IIB family hydrolase [Candidatus Acidoferrum sp.]|jgi:Cof subfamily protein (haloacid dehalogenase superfamily)
MPIRLIALDIDGTLLNSGWHVPDANRIAVQEAVRRGIEVALVTGRRYDFALPVAQDLACPITMIVNNGGLIRSSDGQTRMKRLLSIEAAKSVLEAAREWRSGAAVIFDRPRENQLILERLDRDDSIRYAYYSRNLDFIGIVSPLESCLTEAPLQVMFSGTVAEMEAVEQLLIGMELAPEMKLAATRYASRDFAMLDVLPAGCTKGAALAEWATLQGLQRDEILAIGDNHNDIEMLEFAGISVVMQNCVPELKCYGWHETHSNDENGVAAAIERFALNAAASCV